MGIARWSGSFRLAFRTGYVRTLMASAALVAAVALAGCETNGLRSGKAMKELSPEMEYFRRKEGFVW